MRTDPRKACDKPEESLFWAIVHDVFAHVLMGLTFYSSPSIRFHNWTSEKAWPRCKTRPAPVLLEESWGVSIKTSSGRSGRIWVKQIGEGIYKIYHPFVRHEMVTNASGSDAAFFKAVAWFHTLEKEFGGDFQLR